jgi:hypothetical protein
MGKTTAIRAAIHGGPVGYGDEEQLIGRRKQMAWSNEYLERLLFFSGLAAAPA